MTNAFLNHVNDYKYMKMSLTVSASVLMLFLCLCMGTLTYCEKEAKCDTASVSYKSDIVPLLAAKGCLAASCHASTSMHPYGTYAELKAQVSSERLSGAVNRAAGFSPMPKVGDKLDACSISIIDAWIKQGAKDN
jgi:hypothetical protein